MKRWVIYEIANPDQLPYELRRTEFVLTAETAEEACHRHDHSATMRNKLRAKELAP